MKQRPLAYRMRPQKLEDLVGQEHLIGPGKIINRMVQAQQLSSMILYGPPGIGKTSIATAIAGTSSISLRMLNAATDSKKDLQIVAEEGKMSGRVILLLDEIHRLDKTKQDFLLPHLESGHIILIGATTENPYIAINPAIRSRCQIFELKPLSPQAVATSLQRALQDPERGLGKLKIDLDPQALDHLASRSNGDLRAALNALELAALSTAADDQGMIHLDLAIIEECLGVKAFSHDKSGDNHYDVLSALQKSIRGSDVDAALHYAARLIYAGELVVLMRRLLVIAYEDIGLGNPAGCARVVAAVQAAEKLGLPEARIPIANAVVELALSPKSNTAYRAINSALEDLEGGRPIQVPDHLRSASFSGAKDLGRGQTYKYPHDYPGHWVKQDYLPQVLKNRQYFQPQVTSSFEQALADQYKKLHDQA